ncbi:PucR family transcriptional regulator, partial [Micromonospora zhanjiangensis]
QKPGFLAPWLDLPGARDRLAEWSTLAGVDLVHLGTRADADEIKDTARTQPLLVAADLRQDVYGVLVRAGGELLETLDAFFAAGGVLESAARALYVHPNTVRYRLRRIAEVTGFAPLAPRDAFALRVALTVGRLDPAALGIPNQT